jgi:hypothetical protein
MCCSHFWHGTSSTLHHLGAKTSDILDHSMIATDTQAMTAPTASRVTLHTARLEASRRAPTMIVAQLFPFNHGVGSVTPTTCEESKLGHELFSIGGPGAALGISI